MINQTENYNLDIQKNHEENLHVNFEDKVKTPKEFDIEVLLTKEFL